ncbi:hypothetical protein [Kiritimatiella glycovorans]|uniref:Uncharacterized protein n=1 Tax=Kiritimatiella glycovorans TaxID=1307763 RepID=A0A0G3ELB9_9BACT|nr:hypothetical protein [Kiritimatiella glycovorans]AKJ65565.1 hypothetical protein L21SP4_02339 [Kiritimatiella glycovorans]
MNMEAGKSRRSGRGWVLPAAAGLALLIHLALGMAFDIRMRRSVRPVYRRLHIVHAPRNGTPDAHSPVAAARTLGSPVLFSLPSRYGFSRRFLESGQEGARLGEERKAEATAFLEAAAGPASYLFLHDFQRRPAGAYLPEPASASDLIHLPRRKDRIDRILPPAEAAALRHSPALEPFRRIPGPWEFTVRLRLDASGRVSNVFLDSPEKRSGELATLAMSVLRRMRFDPAAGMRTAHMRLYRTGAGSGNGEDS